jgi:hypothetical protein
MVIHRLWRTQRKQKYSSFISEEWMREGWFLFGIIPLYVRTLSHEYNK